MEKDSLNIKIPTALKVRLRAEARARGLSLTTLVILTLEGSLPALVLVPVDTLVLELAQQYGHATYAIRAWLGDPPTTEAYPPAEADNLRKAYAADVKRIARDTE